MAQVMIAKTHALEVDEARLTPEVREFIFAYGLRQVLNDAGSAGKTPDEKLGMAQKKLDALYAGEVRRQRDAVDEVTAEARKIARKRITEALRAKGKKIKDVDEKQLEEAVNNFAARPDVMEAAREAVEARKGLNANVGDDALEGLL